MELPSWIDEEVVYSLGFWLLTIGAELALMIGFKAQSAWGTEIGMSLFSKIMTLALVPVAAYFITKHRMNN